MIWVMFTKILKNRIQLRIRNILIVFHDMIAVILSNKKLNPIVAELFIRGRKINVFIAFITQFYFTVPAMLD